MPFKVLAVGNGYESFVVVPSADLPKGGPHMPERTLFTVTKYQPWDSERLQSLEERSIAANTTDADKTDA
jgi:hypothetical protein